MIDPKELRLGNYIHNGEEVEIVTAIDTNSIRTNKDSSPTIHPIPITTEWLERLGFIDCNYTFELGKIKLSWYSRVISTGVRTGWSSKKYPHIKYVHQLQNLYFALTGEELKISIQ